MGFSAGERRAGVGSVVRWLTRRQVTLVRVLVSSRRVARNATPPVLASPTKSGLTSTGALHRLLERRDRY